MLLNLIDEQTQKIDILYTSAIYTGCGYPGLF